MKGTDLMNHLKSIRKKQNISQADIADLLGIKPAAVSKYETGRVPLSEEAIEKICQFLNVSADELLGISTPNASAQETPSMFSKVMGQICPGSVTMEEYLYMLLNTIVTQKKQMDQTIRNLYSCGIPTNTIARVTAIAEEQIIKLLKSM